MNVNIAIERSLSVPAPYEKVAPLLKDLESTIGRFPKLKKLTRLDDDTFLWDMQTIGSRIARISHNVSYAAKYSVNTKKGEVSWVPVPKRGNASIEGWFRLIDRGDETTLTFSVRGELREVPVPLMYRMIAPPFIQGKFKGLVEEFLERTGEAVIGKQATAALAAKHAGKEKSR